MKLPRMFLIGMYAHLFLSIAIPLGIFFLCRETGWTKTGLALLALYLLAVTAVQILGWVTAVHGVRLARRGDTETLRRGWKLLKLASIPFYLLNFLYSFFVWFALVGASRGILFLLVPIPILVTCSMVVQSGCLGVCWVKHLQQRLEGIHGVHCALQVLPVTDVVSTILLLRREAKG